MATEMISNAWSCREHDLAASTKLAADASGMRTSSSSRQQANLATSFRKMEISNRCTRRGLMRQYLFNAQAG